jgi:cell division protein FtsB
MHALQPLEPPKSRRARQRRPSKPPSNSHQELAAEIKIKIAANVILSLAAMAALVRLLPYQFAQQEKLVQVHQDVQEIEARVERLRDNFSRNFDPNQMRKIMQEQSLFIDPNQRRIFFK